MPMCAGMKRFVEQIDKPMETDMPILVNNLQQSPPSVYCASAGFLPECQQQPPIENVAIEVLPKDLLVEVLCRVSVRDLLQWRCVSKSWCALIDDVNFIRRHYLAHYSTHKADGDIPLFLDSSGVQLTDSFQVSLLSKQQGDDVLVNLTADLFRDAGEFLDSSPDLSNSGICIGIANGIICFMGQRKQFSLWNPATREFKSIAHPLYQPTSPFRPIDLAAFGFDHVSNTFKIVCQNSVNYEYEIYSVTSNAWNKLEEPLFGTTEMRGTTMEAYLNGACYFNAWYLVSKGGWHRSILILSLNLSTETWEVLDIPDGAISDKIGYKYDWNITLYKESLAFVVSCTDLGKATCNFDIWILTTTHNDSGTPISWHHLYTIGPFPSSDGLILDTFRIDGHVLFLTRCESLEEESSLYDPSTGTFKNLGEAFRFFGVYMESLFPLSERLA